MAASITGRKVIKVARGELKTRERGVNHTKYGRAYGLDGYAWCGQFVWWVFNAAGVNLRKEGITGAASTNAFDAQARHMGWKRIPKENAKPGDVVFYDFGVTGPGDPANDDDHVGIVASRAWMGRLTAIEGNTSSGVGSQADGDGVFQRVRPLSLVRHVYRPPYAAWTHEMRMAEAKTKAQAEARRQAALKKAAAAKKKKAAAAAAAAAALLASGGTAVVAGDPTPTAPPAATATPTATPTLTPTPRPTVKPTPAAKPPRQARMLTYTPGRAYPHGADVRRVQRLVGLRGKSVDGQYGPATSRAVARWQRRHHLKADGQFGKVSAHRAGWDFR